MSETRIAFLYKASSLLPGANINKTQEKLKSYYRMRCMELTKGHGLPQKQFSTKAMCSHCGLDWTPGTEITVKSIELSKRQKKRIKSRNKILNHANKSLLLHSNTVEQICNFCKHSTKMVVPKANKVMVKKTEQPIKKVKSIPKKLNDKMNTKNKNVCDVYSNTVQVFSLSNKNNTLKSSIKEPKIIKNNKKKKDKFAGLCQKAVMTSARLKQEKLNQGKLALFLKPSS